MHDERMIREKYARVGVFLSVPLACANTHHSDIVLLAVGVRDHMREIISCYGAKCPIGAFSVGAVLLAE